MTPSRNDQQKFLASMQATFPADAECQFLLALSHHLTGDIPQAVVILEQLVRADPGKDNAWEMLRHCHMIAGDTERVIESNRRWISSRPDNAAAQYLLKTVYGDDIPDRACANHIVDSFDRGAKYYDAIQISLAYHGPISVDQVLQKTPDVGKNGLTVLDAGCGTGLISGILRPYARQLAGIDLSGGMLDLARKTECYDRLDQCDIAEHLADNVDSYDLIVAADTFCYFGDIEKLIPNAIASLRKNGQMLFSLDPGQLSPESWFLQPNGRFGHSPAYIIRVLGENGIPAGVMRRVKWRRENGKDHFALLIAITRPENNVETGPD